MTGAIRAVFKIRPGEGVKVLQFVALFLLIQAGTTIGFATSDSLFLSTDGLGPELLPRIYVLVPLFMLIYIPVSSYLTTKWGIARLFLLTLIALVAGGIALWSLLRSFSGTEVEKIVLHGAKIYSAVTFIALYSISWNFTYQYFNILEGKRLFAFFTGGSAIGAIAGGILVNVLPSSESRSSMFELYLVWAGLALLAIPVLISILAKRKVIESDQLEEPDEAGILQQTAQLGGIIRRSRYVLILLAVLFSAQVLTTLNEFQYLNIFSANFPDPAELAGQLGKLIIGVNIFNLFISTFVFNRMVLRFGVRNIALILPLVYIVVFSCLFLSNGVSGAMLLYAGYFGFFAYQGLMVAIDYDNTNLLLNALPSEAKTQVRTFIEGLAEPLATATAGVFLLSIGSGLSADTLSLIGLGGAFVYLLLVLALRNNYASAMITNLKKSWLDFSRNSDEVVTGLETKDLSLLETEARSRNPETAPTAISILWLNDQNAAADALLDFMTNVSPEDREKAEPLFAQLLKERDSDLFRRILDWLERDQARIDTELIQEISVSGLPQKKYLARLMKSPGPQEQATAGLQLLKSWKLEDRARGLEVFDNLFANEASTGAAVHAIGRTSDERYAHFVAPYLRSANPEIREQALTAVNRLVTRDSGRLVPMLLEVVRDGPSERRLTAMDALARIGDPQSINPLLSQAGTFTALERRKAEAVVESVGLQGVPMAVSVLRSRKVPFRGRAIAAHSLGKLAFAQYDDIYGDLILPELDLAYRSLYRHEILAAMGRDSPGIEVLCQLFLSGRMRVVEFVLELLSIAGRLPDFELISASLRSANAKEQGNAIETIEQGVSQEMFRLLLPLIDTRSLEDRIRFYIDNFDAPEVTVEEILSDALNSRFPIGCMVGAQALWELHGEASFPQLRQALQTAETRETKNLILSLMGVEKQGLNLVEKIFHLMRCSLFESFGPLSLERVAEQSEPSRFGDGEYIFKNGERALDLHCLVEGDVRCVNGASRAIRQGEVFGEECLFGEVRESDAVSGGAKTLCVSKRAVTENVDVYPETALHLLEYARRRSS